MGASHDDDPLFDKITFSNVLNEFDLVHKLQLIEKILGGLGNGQDVPTELIGVTLSED